MEKNKNQQAKKEMQELEAEEQKLFSLMQEIKLKKQENTEPEKHEKQHKKIGELIRQLNLALLDLNS